MPDLENIVVFEGESQAIYDYLNSLLLYEEAEEEKEEHVCVA